MTVNGVGVSRRQALRAGAYVAGAAWVVPAVTVIGAGPASADSPSGSTPPPVKPPEKPEKPVTPQPPDEPEVLGNSYENPPAVAPVVAAQEQQRSVLAFTGADVTRPAAVAAGLVAGGAALRVASRRRPAAEAAGEGPADAAEGLGD